MKKKNVFITGATGGMGYETLKQILGDTDKLNVTILVRDSQKNHKLLEPYGNTEGLRILWGDLLDFDCVYEGVKEADLVLFGHTHRIFYEQHNGLSMLNPGSIGEPRYPGKPSYGRVIIENGQIFLHTFFL